MTKHVIRVVFSEEAHAGAPGALGKDFYFKPGESFLTRAWFYPGEPFEKGSIGDKLGHVQTEWHFWTSFDIDYALIFGTEHIGEVIIPNDPETIEIFKDAPFKVTIRTEKGER